jgi:NodT family efflux transporter outer membrane factor (OMF) lipoprotein
MQIWRHIPWLFCILLAAGCAAGPDFVRPDLPAVDHYTQGTDPEATVAADGQVQRFEQGAGIEAGWWRLFGSPVIDSAVLEAIAGNQTLEAAQARLRQSEENLQAGHGIFYPQLDAGFAAARQKFSPARIGSSSLSSIFNLYTLSATVVYSLDLFGEKQRTVEGLQARTDFEREAVRATYLSLTGNIVNTLIARAGYAAQIRATEEIISLLADQVRLAGVQVQAGTAPYSKLLGFRAQLAAAQATLPSLRQKVNQADHLLAILTGRAPAEWTAPQIELSDIALPGTIPVALPSALVRQRPDILAAEAQLHSASAAIGVATAAMFPIFTLSSQYGLSSASANDLFSHKSSFWNLGGDVSLPLFHGGALQHGRSAAVERYRQALSEYRQTVLNSLAQVADTLRALEHDAELLVAQSEALDASGQAVRLVQTNYEAGAVDYGAVLIINSQYQQASLNHIQARAQRLQDTVALFVALGGSRLEGHGSAAVETHY